jgi:hypothetical protein
LEPVAAKLYDDCQEEAADAYSNDLASGRLDALFWSLFSKPLTAEDVAALPRTLTHAKNTDESPQDPNYCSLKNESIPLRLLLDANGHDEEFDDSHGWQDSEICNRLINRHGMQWWGKSGGEVSVVDPRPVFYFRKQKQPTFWNERLLREKTVGAPHLPINPSYNLRELRKWTLPDHT